MIKTIEDLLQELSGLASLTENQNKKQATEKIEALLFSADPVKQTLARFYSTGLDVTLWEFVSDELRRALARMKDDYDDTSDLLGPVFDTIFEVVVYSMLAPANSLVADKAMWHRHMHTQLDTVFLKLGLISIALDKARPK